MEHKVNDALDPPDQRGAGFSLPSRESSRLSIDCTANPIFPANILWLERSKAGGK